MSIKNVLKRVASESDQEALKRHLDQNPIQGQEYADTVYVSRDDDLDEDVYIAFMWNGHGHQSIHVIGTSEDHQDVALQNANLSGTEEYWVKDIEEAREEWYFDETGRSLSGDLDNDNVDQKIEREADEVAHEMIDGVVYTMTKQEFGEVAMSSKGKSSGISDLYDEDIDE